MTEGEAYPLGILVEAAGRKFQDDFESVLAWLTAFAAVWLIVG